MAEEKEYKATIYDDVWRTLVHDFPQLLVSFVNELFAESYGKDARVEFLQDVHEQNQPDGSIGKRTTDTYFRIVDEHGNCRKYHIECQSSADSSMLVRIFEYGAQIALDDAEKSESKIVLELPHAAVLFLRSTAKTPDNMEIQIKTPGGRVLEYEAKTIYRNGVAAGVEQGRSQGISQERNNMIVGMLKKNLSLEDIAEIARTTVDQVVTIGKKAALL